MYDISLRVPYGDVAHQHTREVEQTDAKVSLLKKENFITHLLFRVFMDESELNRMAKEHIASRYFAHGVANGWFQDMNQKSPAKIMEFLKPQTFIEGFYSFDNRDDHYRMVGFSAGDRSIVWNGQLEIGDFIMFFFDVTNEKGRAYYHKQLTDALSAETSQGRKNNNLKLLERAEAQDYAYYILGRDYSSRI